MEVGQHLPGNNPGQSGVLDAEKYRSLILDGGFLVLKIYRRAIIYDYPNRFPEGIFYEDNAIGNSWFLRAKRFEYLPEPLYYYYQHDSSTVHTVTEERCKDRLAAARLMIAEAHEFGYYDEYLAELEYKFTLLFYLNTVFSYMRGVKRPRYRFVKALVKELQAYFPRFRENCYFLARHDAEVQRLAALHCRSTLLYMLYFKLLYFYRDLRYGK
jgi:hypothetical protein